MEGMIDIEALYYKKDFEGRVWSRVKIGKPNECWIWQGYVSHGYGTLRVMKAPGSKAQRHLRAHRLAWWLENSEPLPPDMLVIHSCNTPLCCNPRHLRLGTHKQNMEDVRKAGNQAGAKNGNAKLTAQAVVAIREARQSGQSLKAIAEAHKIKVSSVSSICLGKIWKDAGGPIQTRRKS